jgi:hypothetical protein
MSKCQPAHKIVGEIWEAYGPAITQAGVVIGSAAGQPALMAALVAAGEVAAEVTKDMVSFWNSKIASNSWATIGPRRLDFGTKLEGKLLSTGGRYFICPELSRHETIRIEVWEEKGKAKTEVSFHLMNPKTGECRDEGNYLFNDNNDEKKNERQHVSKTISNALGFLPIVHLDAKSVANSFEYTVRLTAA